MGFPHLPRRGPTPDADCLLWTSLPQKDPLLALNGMDRMLGLEATSSQKMQFHKGILEFLDATAGRCIVWVMLSYLKLPWICLTTKIGGKNTLNEGGTHHKTMASGV